MKKNYSWLLWAVIIAFCAFVSSCGENQQMTVKCHIVGSGVKHVVHIDRGYDQGDTIIYNLKMQPRKVVIDTILIK